MNRGDVRPFLAPSPRPAAPPILTVFPHEWRGRGAHVTGRGRPLAAHRLNVPSP